MQDNDQVLELSREIREAFNTNFALTKDGLSEMKSNFNLSYSSINPASYLKIAKSLKDIQDDVISVSERHPRIIDAYDSALLCFGSFASSYWLHQSLFALILVGLGCLSIVF
ncbi:hypothetical protein A3715_19505 [Oleiphilus sp. HI0009]|nr:hypothetical protein A3715_19505 [Oleiphilus sp. HI0009]